MALLRSAFSEGSRYYKYVAPPERRNRSLRCAGLILVIVSLVVGFVMFKGIVGADPLSFVSSSPSTPILVFFAIAFSTFISEDLTCIGTGVLIAQGRVGLALGIAACLFGIFVGDILLFLAGRYFGRLALSSAPLKWFVRESDVDRCSKWFRRRGIAAIAISRFIPGTRLPTYFAAGLLDTSLLKFSFYFLLAAAVWTPLLVIGSMTAGDRILLAQQSWLKSAVIVVSVFIIVRTCFQLTSFRSRRLLVGRWRRLTRWEFWPLWFFYPPVFLYVIYLGLKFRSLTLFTCVNPAIEESGFVGESKFAILQGLKHESREFVPLTGLLTNERFKQVQQFMLAHSLNFPIVLKPNSGERGSGVAVIRSQNELRDYLERAEGDVIIQQYAPGSEFGVFYYRLPDQPRGKIFSITRKVFPSVIGDGASTLESLILNDKRAVSLARVYFENQKDRLSEIPSPGERVQLIEIGTHCRGSVFLDGSDIKTDELEEAIDGIARGYEGFYFGRFDIRTPSIDDFKRGRNFKIVELNGVTSESTNIYDPKNSLFDAYRVLFQQWRLAFEIGDQNRKRGLSPVSLKHLLRIIFKNSRREHERSGQHLRLTEQEGL